MAEHRDRSEWIVWRHGVVCKWGSLWEHTIRGDMRMYRDVGWEEVAFGGLGAHEVGREEEG